MIESACFISSFWYFLHLKGQQPFFERSKKHGIANFNFWSRHTVFLTFGCNVPLSVQCPVKSSLVPREVTLWCIAIHMLRWRGPACQSLMSSLCLCLLDMLFQHSLQICLRAVRLGATLPSNVSGCKEHPHRGRGEGERTGNKQSIRPNDGSTGNVNTSAMFIFSSVEWQCITFCNWVNWSTWITFAFFSFFKQDLFC